MAIDYNLSQCKFCMVHLDKHRILFVIEPYPLRSKWEFYHVFITFLKLRYSLRDIEKCSILCPAQYIEQALPSHQVECESCNFILYDNYPQFDYFSRRSTAIWSAFDVKQWSRYAVGDDPLLTNILGSIFDKIQEEFEFNTFIYWGCNRPIFNFCIAKQVLPISMELGCTRKPFADTFYLDGLGVNGFAYSRYFNLSKKILGKIDRQKINNFLPPLISSLKNTNLVDLVGDVLNQIVYLVPLQLCDDANVVIHSDFNSMYEFLEFLLTIIPNGCSLVVKPHPGATNPTARLINRVDHKKCAELCEQNPRLHWLASSLETVLHYKDQFAGVLSINSSLAFEFSLLDVPILLFGYSCFGNSMMYKNDIPFLNQIGLLPEDEKNAILNFYLHHSSDIFCPEYLLRAIDFNRSILEFLIDQSVDMGSHSISDSNKVLPLALPVPFPRSKK